jgi:hypothetical protein
LLLRECTATFIKTYRYRVYHKLSARVIAGDRRFVIA